MRKSFVSLRLILDYREKNLTFSQLRILGRSWTPCLPRSHAFPRIFIGACTLFTHDAISVGGRILFSNEVRVAGASFLSVPVATVSPIRSEPNIEAPLLRSVRRAEREPVPRVEH